MTGRGLTLKNSSVYNIRDHAHSVSWAVQRHTTISAMQVCAISIAFYILMPLLSGITKFDWDALTSTAILVIGYAAAWRLEFRRMKRSHARELLISKSTSLLYILSCTVIAFVVVQIVASGATPLTMSRQQLFHAREAHAGQLVSLAAVFVGSTIGLFANRSGKRLALAGGILLLVYDGITLSRGDILVMTVSLYIFGENRKIFWYIAATLFAITALRVSHLSIERFSLLTTYLGGESLNIATAVAAVPRSLFHVSWLQTLRPLASVFPLIGRVLEIKSEALEFNALFQTAFGYSGVAFGILGFAKFAGILKSAVLSIQLCIISFMAGRLRLAGPHIILALLTGIWISYLRWGPGESISVFTKLLIILLLVRGALVMLPTSGRA